MAEMRAWPDAGIHDVACARARARAAGGGWSVGHPAGWWLVGWLVRGTRWESKGREGEPGTFFVFGGGVGWAVRKGWGSLTGGLGR
eukprot:362751-Chlamydomonas_euryale.AAC.2